MNSTELPAPTAKAASMSLSATDAKRFTKQFGSPWLRGSSLVALTMIGLVVLLIVVVPLLPGYDPYTQSLRDNHLAPFESASHLLGTDSIGRDILSRVSLAGRVSLLVAVAVVTINIAIGSVLGLTAGYFRGKWETVVMFVIDLQLGVPVMILLIAAIAAVGAGIWTLIVVLGVTFWVRYGRVARAMAISLRSRQFVRSAITQGASNAWIIRKHLFPGIVPQLVVLGTFDLGVVITAEASLSYLGLGIQAPTPSWGAMISDGQVHLQTNPWLVIVPGTAVFLLLGGIQILSQNFTSETEFLK